MSCRRCGEEENFIDGNEEEELCKHCLDHCCEECFNELETEEEHEHCLCKDCYEPEENNKSYCNYCSKLCLESHKCGKDIVEDVLLNVVGGEKGLVKQILGYKRDLEYEERTINIHRLLFLERFDKIKTIKIINRFDKKLEIVFKPEGKYTKTYRCELELNKPIKFEEREDLFKYFFQTFDLPLAKFMENKKTNENMKKYIKRSLRILNDTHNQIDSYIIY